MKRLCKNVDITDIPTILPWVRDCILRHRRRHDFRKLLFEHGLEPGVYYEALETHDTRPWETAIRSIAATAAQSIYEGGLDIRPPTVKARFDGASGKLRNIGCECAMHQVYDSIAVNASTLRRTIQRLSVYMAEESGLRIKPNWSIRRFTDVCGIDMMGFVVYPSGKVEIRARDWVKVRRMILRSTYRFNDVSYKQAKRLTSYKGYLVHSDSKETAAKYRAGAVFHAAQQVVSITERRCRNVQRSL